MSVSFHHAPTRLPRFSVAALVLAFGLAGMLSAVVGLAAWSLQGTGISQADLRAREQAAYQRGMNDGVARGRADGLKSGRSAGLSAGVIRGRKAGFAAGLARGHKLGYALGRTDGYNQGYAAGLAAPKPKRHP